MDSNPTSQSTSLIRVEVKHLKRAEYALKSWRLPGLLTTFILIAVILRLAAAYYLGDTLTGTQQVRAQDQTTYDALAQSLLAGRGYSFEQDWYPGFTRAGKQTAHWSFLYPLYLAGVYAIFGHHPLAARLLQVLASGMLSAWLLYRLGRRLANEQVGLAAALLGAVYAYFVYYDAALMTESFFTLGVLATFEISLGLVGIDFPPRDTASARQLGAWLLLGAVLGLTTLLRQTLLLWLPFWLGWIYWARSSRIRWYGPLVSLGIMAACILPWTARNYAIYDAFLPLNSNAGYAFYSANHPNHGIQFDQDYAAPLPDDLRALGLNEAQWNTALTQRGVEIILADPQRYLLLSLDRIPIFFNAWFSPESTLVSNLMRVLSFGLYLPLFIYGLALSFRDARRFALVYLFALVFSAMHIFIWASVRYRLPIDALMMPLAGMALLDLARRLGIQVAAPVSA
jgi:4-amino-4-deoxy-L-arabinose transferase-like glycosyltransferase